MTTTNPPAAQAGSYRVGDLDLNRIGYGAMQLAGPGVFGPPRDRAAAIEVLRTAVELGVNHIDTADAYGPYITNEIIREALFPYGDHVHIVTKVGLVRDEQGGWLPANSPQSLREQVHDNLRRLGLDVLDVVNLRTLAGIDDRATVPDTLTPQFEALAELQQQGLIRHLGLSTVGLAQLAEAQQIAPVVCVQNFYNIANRADAAVLAATAEQHIAYVPWPIASGAFATADRRRPGMLSARTVFEENFDNDEAFRLFCSEVGDERAELAWHGPNHSPDNIFIHP